MQAMIKGRSARQTLNVGLIAGIVGGAAEVAWIALYLQLQGGASSEVARGITETVFPGTGVAPFAVALGLVIHMVLAVLLGGAVAAVFARAFPSLAGTATEFAAIVGVLALVWTMNFLVILPVINPAFVTIVPYGASLTSKLLFGVAAAMVFRAYGAKSRA
ncbi:MAG: hypothetical protein Q8P60_16015 [Pseudorhodobacter sp.]|nr:hypothetical protein [Pseudorhodobacter sp.]